MGAITARARRALSRLKDESGQGALVAVLVLLLLGGLMMPPLLSLMSTGLNAGRMHESKLEEFYAADSGVEDALWQIKYDELEYLFAGYPYDEYDYDQEYDYTFVNEVNSNAVNVTIQNIWMPKDIAVPTPEEASDVVEDAKLVVTGSVSGLSEYRIRITYNYQDIADPDWDELEVDVIGIWLPPGFDYVDGSSNLEEDDDDPYYCVPATEPYKSGTVVEWDFDPAVLFTDFPGVDLWGYPLVTDITFEFSGPAGDSPQAALSWVTTAEVSDVSFAWDADTKVYEITSVSSEPGTGEERTVVEAHTAKSEMRKMTSAIEGDYFATGNSLMTGNPTWRDQLLKESSTTIDTDEDGIDGIPTQGMVEAAFLYWTGWIDWHYYDTSGGDIELFYDSCTDLYSAGSNWNYGSDWHESGSYTAFYAHHSSGGGRELTLKASESLDLSEYLGHTVEVSWRSWNYSYGPQDYNDCLQYSFSGDGGDNWSDWVTEFCNEIGTSAHTYSYEIPDTEAYRTDDVRIRFRIQNYSGSNEYVYIDNVSVTTSGSAGGSLEYPDNPTTETLTALIEQTARTNKVLFGTTEENTEEVTADAWEIEPSTGSDWEGTWSYCCFKDATSLVRQWIEDGDIDNNAAGTYTVGHVVAENEVDPDFSFDLYPRPPYEETGYPLGTPAAAHYPRYQYSHAGWSLIIIYTSPETKGHQLYLYDIQNPDFEFAEAWGPTNPNPDFDGDGDPGGRISGFLVPEPIEDEEIAAKLTIFAGEGDEGITGEHVEVNDERLSEPPINPDGNMWNSQSPGLSEDGVDVDTFYVEWDDGILEPGNTSAQVDMPTGNDGFNTIYIILSFRSETTTGGTVSFLIAG